MNEAHFDPFLRCWMPAYLTKVKLTARLKVAGPFDGFFKRMNLRPWMNEPSPPHQFAKRWRLNGFLARHHAS